MGFWGRQWRRVKNYSSENVGAAARTATVATVAVVASATPCGPVCGGLAAAATDGLFGGPIERNARRATEAAAERAEGWFDDPSGAAPPELPGTIEGTYSTVRSIGLEGEPESRFAAPSDGSEDGPKAKPIILGLAAAAAMYGVYRAVKGGK